MKVAAPRPMIAISRLQSLDCSGLFRRMTAIINMVRVKEKVKSNQELTSMSPKWLV
jgi:hypothetical protein